MVRDIVDLCGGTDEIVLCIKDMAGVGSITRIGRLIDAIRQRWPELVIGYHRHITDGLAMPALLAAAKAGAKILDAEEDSLVRFYGHSPILAVQAFLEESGHPGAPGRAPRPRPRCSKAREWVGAYDWAESPVQGPRPHGDAAPDARRRLPQLVRAGAEGRLPAPDARRPQGHVALQPHRALLRRDARLADHLGDLQRAREPLRQGARRRRRRGPDPAADDVRRGEGPGPRGDGPPRTRRSC